MVADGIIAEIRLSMVQREGEQAVVKTGNARNTTRSKLNSSSANPEVTILDARRNALDRTTNGRVSSVEACNCKTWEDSVIQSTQPCNYGAI